MFIFFMIFVEILVSKCMCNKYVFKKCILKGCYPCKESYDTVQITNIPQLFITVEVQVEDCGLCHTWER